MQPGENGLLGPNSIGISLEIQAVYNIENGTNCQIQFSSVIFKSLQNISPEIFWDPRVQTILGSLHINIVQRLKY